MRKKISIFIAVLLSLILISPVKATLYEYYKERGQKIPSFQERTILANSCGIKGYNASANHNIRLEKCLRDSDPILGIAPINVVALFETSLVNNITDSATSMTLVNGTDKQGNTLNGTYGFIIDEGTTSEEFVIATCVNTSCTSMTRGISVTDGKTSITSLKKSHRKGSSVKITDYPILGRLNAIIIGNESTGSSTFKIGDSTTSTNQTIKADNGVTNLPFVRYNNSTNRWQYSDDGLNTIDFATSSSSGLSASTTRGIGITNSQIHINASSTTGMTFDSNGYLYQLVSSTLALESDSQGIKINTSTLVNLIATTTPTSNKIPIASTTGQLSREWVPFGFGGDCTDGALTISTGTTTINLGGASEVTKNYSSISITGTGALTFSNPHANGTLVIFKSCGDFIVTSTINPAIDLRSIGATGGSGGSGAGGSGSKANDWIAGFVDGGGGGNAGAGGNDGSGGAGGSSASGAGSNGSNGSVVAGGTRGSYAYWNANSSQYILAYARPGAGGGAGGSGDNMLANGANGGRGGGGLYIEVKGTLNFTGIINASGSVGGNGTLGATNYSGSGGGGAGGSISILYNTLTANTGTCSVSGGAGGSSAGLGTGGSGASGFCSIKKNISY